MKERQFVRSVYLKSLLPISLSVLLIQICSVANNILVGRLIDSAFLPVMSLVSPVSFVFATVGSLLGVGGSIRAAHCKGNREEEECNRCLYMAVSLSAVFGLLLTAFIMIFPGVVLSILGVPADLQPETRKYLLFFAPAAFAAMGIYVPFNFLKINGAQKYGIYVSGIMTVVTIGLDFLLTKGFGMGIEGIALASTIGYWAATVPGILMLYSRKGGFRIPASKNLLKGLGKIALSGSPSAVNNLCNLLRSFFMNMIIGAALHNAGLSAFSVVSTVFLLSVTVSNGTSLTMAPFAAVFSSEKDNKSLRQVFSVAVISAIVLMTVFAGFVELFPVQIAHFFSITDEETVATVVIALRIFAVSLIVSGVNVIFTTFYQCIKQTLLSNILTVIRSFGFVAAFAAILAHTAAPEWLWFSFLIAEVLSLAVTFIAAFVISRVKKHTTSVLLLDNSAEADGTYLAFSVNNTNESVSEVTEQITAFCERNELSPKLTMAITLAVEEILVLFNTYALNDANSRFYSNVRILLHNGIIVLRFRTVGKQFDPVSYSETNDDLMSDTMGIRMVQKMSEIVMYDRVFGVNNLTILF